MMGFMTKPADWFWSVALKKAAARVARAVVGGGLGLLATPAVQHITDALGMHVTVDPDKTAAALAAMIYGAIEVGYNRWKHRSKVAMTVAGQP